MSFHTHVQFSAVSEAFHFMQAAPYRDSILYQLKISLDCPANLITSEKRKLQYQPPAIKLKVIEKSDSLDERINIIHLTISNIMEVKKKSIPRSK